MFLFFCFYTFLILISVRGRPSSKKSILSSVQVTTTPELETDNGSKHVGLQTAMCNIIWQLEPEKGQPLSVLPFVKLIFFHMTTNNHTQATVSFAKAVSRLFLSIAFVSRFMQRLTWRCACGYYYEKSLSQPTLGRLRCQLAWLVSLPDQWPWFLALEWDYVRACVQKLKKWRPSQWVAAWVCCEQLLKVELELRRN